MRLEHRSSDVIAMFAVSLASAVLVVFFIGRFSYMPDDGAYAYVASRMLSGLILNLDIQDVHAGYVNFANALSMLVFGESFLGQRGLIGILTVAQTGLVFWLLRDRGHAVAVCGTAAFATLTFLQFLNPTAHWYCLFLTITIVAVIERRTHFSGGRLLLVGFLVGTIFLFRQLTGVIVAFAVAATILINSSHPNTSKDSKFAKAVWGLGHLLLATYIWSRASAVEWLLYGIWPLWIGWYVIRHRTIETAEVARIALWSSLGVLTAAAPLLAYHVWHGSVIAWIYDTFVVAITMSGFDFMLEHRYWHFLGMLINQAMGQHGVTGVINVVYWLILALTPLAAGALCIKVLHRQPSHKPVSAFLVMAPYFALVSLHYQIPIYVFYSVAFVSVAALIGLAEFSPRHRLWAPAACAYVCAVGVFFHAGQPLSRGIEGILAGMRMGDEVLCDAPRLSLRIESSACQSLKHLLSIIATNVTEHDTILALPSDAELNFLSGRASPLPFFNSALGIASRDRYTAAVDVLRTTPPALVFHRIDDKYNSELTLELVEWIRQRYELLEIRDGIAVYSRAIEN